MPNYELLFATPLLRVAMEPAQLADDLQSLILDREKEEFRHPNSPQRSHSSVFESRFDFHTWEDKPVADFRGVFFAHVGAMVQEVNGWSNEELLQLGFECHCWFHITRDGGYFQPHNHPNAAWSAIYCVDPGDDKPDDSSHAGHLFFQDPRPAARMYLDVANRRMDRTLSFNAIRFRPRRGELVVFPSYLEHSVEPYQGERPRITIAANFWFGHNTGT